MWVVEARTIWMGLYNIWTCRKLVAIHQNFYNNLFLLGGRWDLKQRTGHGHKFYSRSYETKEKMRFFVQFSVSLLYWVSKKSFRLEPGLAYNVANQRSTPPWYDPCSQPYIIHKAFRLCLYLYLHFIGSRKAKKEKSFLAENKIRVTNSPVNGWLRTGPPWLSLFVARLAVRCPNRNIKCQSQIHISLTNTCESWPCIWLDRWSNLHTMCTAQSIFFVSAVYLPSPLR